MVGARVDENGKDAAFRRLLSRTVVLPLVLVSVLSAGLIGQILYLKALNRWVDRTDRIISQSNYIQSLFVDAETGMRGFLLTREEVFLDPYNRALSLVAPALSRLRELTAGDPGQQARVDDLEGRWEDWIRLAQRRIRTTRDGGTVTLEQSENGKAAMDAIRGIARAMIEQEEAYRIERVRATDTWSWVALLASVAAALSLGVVFALVGRRQLVALSGSYEDVLAARERQTAALRAQEWINRGRAQLGEEVRSEQTENGIAARILGSVGQYVGAVVGVLYARDESPDRMRRLAGLALASADEGGPPEVLELGESWVGQVALEGRLVTLGEVPEEHVKLASGTGASVPRHLVVAPLTASGRTVAVVELGFVSPPTPDVISYLGAMGEVAGSALQAAQYQANLQRLLAATQRQAHELQQQQEELRVTNEELQEQSRAVQQSQARLEEQQEELRASNAQLERQRDDLERAQTGLVEKADELARANQYKSEFMANMSHELRTPLNSALILAKLLADNRQGNLTPEQVKFAQTIHSAGNDLLTLINDILDLSRIEAGRVDLAVESVAVAGLVRGLERTFEPMAAERRLRLVTDVDPATPATFQSDPQRLQQILKNLLSNALKFTEHGEVSLRVAPSGPDRIVFHVRDTGIGIPKDKQAVVFEAFRQVDGSTHRVYGGSGLGLSISRDLAHLLGGEIFLESSPGQGSTFSLVLPVRLARAAQRPAEAAAGREAPPPPPAPERRVPADERPPPPPVRSTVRDDRDDLAPDSRVILVIEDDGRFAQILYDLAHEKSFRCLVAASAAEGAELARRFRPSAILLDINLPDESGLSVLERLKHSGDTRHIPVHVLSVADYSRRALELGAVGYAVKPVDREQLVQAFDRLREKLDRQTSRVLVVEDAEIQRDSLRQLLSSEGVEITTVATAEAALGELRQSTFDCMVLDLGLPDLSGFDLLERMSADPAFSFPPVIVYTGRALGPDEEMRLRRYSSAVVIKGARSPERLLDEVTLFLHRVESSLPREQQRMLREARARDAAFEGRHILVAEDDVRNIFALSSVLEPRGARVEVARDGQEALAALERAGRDGAPAIDLVLMDIMMPVMDGLTAIREIRARPEWRRIPIIALTAKAMADDRERCLAAGANDYIAKPLEVEKLLSLVRVWMPK